MNDKPIILVNNINEAISIALQQPTLEQALTYLAIWENDRAVKQALEYRDKGITTHNGAGWETYFGYIFKQFLTLWDNK